MPSADPVRSQHARVAALARSAREPSGTAMLEAANRAFRDSFALGHECSMCAGITIDQTLPAAERERQAGAAYKLHMTRLALRASAARRKAANARRVAERAEAELHQLQRDDDAV
jgi:hypothetical protein